MRAMSLVSSDSEGEQNELRNLQEKLESTMKLVTNLSGQLSELKDQVKGQTPSPTPHPILTAVSHPNSGSTHAAVMKHLTSMEGTGGQKTDSPLTVTALAALTLGMYMSLFLHYLGCGLNM